MINKSTLKRLLDPSLWLLFLTNLSVIYYVIEAEIDLANLIYIYLGQNLIIGFFTFLKLFQIRKHDDTLTGFLPIPFPIIFAIHYSIFNGMYFLVLTAFSIGNLDMEYIFTGIGILFFNHLFSFIYNWKNLASQSFMEESVRPYLRIVPMHLIMIIIPSITITILIKFFLFLKIAVDMFSHYIKYNPKTNYYLNNNDAKKNKREQISFRDLPAHNNLRISKATRNHDIFEQNIDAIKNINTTLEHTTFEETWRELNKTNNVTKFDNVRIFTKKKK